MKRAVVFLLLILSGPVAVSTPAEVALPAPLQVEAILFLDDRYGAVPWETPRVVVDLGRADGRSRPARETYQRMTLLGTRGSVPAVLDEIFKICAYLCGDENEECHYVGHFVPSRPLESLGTVVAAIPGNFALESYAPIESVAPSATAPTALSEEFTTPIWPEDNAGRSRQRIQTNAEGGVFEYAWDRSSPNEYPIRNCEWTPRGPLTRLACEGLEALTVDGVPLLVSVQDYNEAGADLLASFEYGGTEWFVLRLALKAQTVHGLVYRDSAGWHALISPRDYSLLC